MVQRGSVRQQEACCSEDVSVGDHPSHLVLAVRPRGVGLAWGWVPRARAYLAAHEVTQPGDTRWCCTLYIIKAN